MADPSDWLGSFTEFLGSEWLCRQVGNIEDSRLTTGLVRRMAGRFSRWGTDKARLRDRGQRYLDSAQVRRSEWADRVRDLAPEDCFVMTFHQANVAPNMHPKDQRRAWIGAVLVIVGCEDDTRLVCPIDLFPHCFGSHADQMGSTRALKQRISVPGQPLRVPLSSFTDELMEQAAALSCDPIPQVTEKSLLYQWFLPELGVDKPADRLKASWKSVSVPVVDGKAVDDDQKIPPLFGGDDRGWVVVKFVAHLMVQLETGADDHCLVYKYLMVLYQVYLMRHRNVGGIPHTTRDAVVRRHRRVARKLDKLAAAQQGQPQAGFETLCAAVERECKEIMDAVERAANADLSSAEKHRRLPEGAAGCRVQHPHFEWPEEVVQFCKRSEQPVPARLRPLQQRASITSLQGLSFHNQLRILTADLSAAVVSDPQLAQRQHMQALLVAEQCIFDMGPDEFLAWSQNAQVTLVELARSLRGFAIQYSAAMKRIPWHPEHYSRSVLVLFCVMSCLDAIVVADIPQSLAEEYGPSHGPECLETLLLTDRAQMECALRVSQYLKRRSTRRPRRFFGSAEDLVHFAADYARADAGISQRTERVVAEANRAEMEYWDVTVPDAKKEEERNHQLYTETDSRHQQSVEEDAKNCRENHWQFHTRYYCKSYETKSLKREVKDYYQQWMKWEQLPKALLLPLPEGYDAARSVLFFAHMPEILAAAVDVAALARKSLLRGDLPVADQWAHRFRPVQHYTEKSFQSVDGSLVLEPCMTDQHLGGSRVVRRPGAISTAGKFVWHDPVDQRKVDWGALMERSDSDFAARCTWQAHPSELQRWLRSPEPEKEVVEDNAVLAAQWNMPRGMTKKQWICFGWIRRQAELQLRRVATALRDHSVDHCAKASRSLILQALTQAGPVCGDRAAFVWKRDLRELEWMRGFAGELLALVQELHFQHHEALLLAILVANFMMQHEPSFGEVLQLACRTAKDWESAVERQLDDLRSGAGHDPKLEGHLLRTRRALLAYQVVGRRFYPRDLPAEEARQLLRARVSLSDKELHEGPLHDDDLTKWVDETMVVREAALMDMASKGTDVFSCASGQTNTPGIKWCTTTPPYVQAQSAAGALQLDLQTGVLLVDGMRSMRLPGDVLAHELYVRVLGKMSPAVNRIGVEYRTRELLNGRTYEFSMLSEGGLCVREHDAAGAIRVLVPPGLLPLPPALCDDCSHWWDANASTVQVRGAAYHEHEVRYEIKIEGRRATVKKLDADSGALQLVPYDNVDLQPLMRVLSKLDRAEHVLPWCTADGKLRRVDYQRGDRVWFSLTASEDGSLCDSSGRVLRHEQQVPAVMGFENYLTFESEGGGVEIVIPNGRVDRIALANTSVSSDSVWQNIVFRSLRPDECPQRGIYPKNGQSRRTVHEHIANGSNPNYPSNYVSTSREPASALRFAWDSRERGDTRVCAIDLNQIPRDRVFDVSAEHGCAVHRVTGGAKRFAVSTHEVCIEGYVPAEAVLATVRLSEFLMPDDQRRLAPAELADKMRQAMRAAVARNCRLFHLAVTDRLGAPAYFRYVLDPELRRLRPAERGSAHAALFLAFIHVLTSTELPEELTGETGMEAALELLRECRQNHPFTEQERELLRRMLALGSPEAMGCFALQHAVRQLDSEARAVRFVFASDQPARTDLEVHKVWTLPVAARRAKLRCPPTLWPQQGDHWDECAVFGVPLGTEEEHIRHDAVANPFADLGLHRLPQVLLEPVYPLFDSSSHARSVPQRVLNDRGVLGWDRTVTEETFGNLYALARSGSLARCRLSYYALHASSSAQMQLLRVVDVVLRARAAGLDVAFPAFPTGSCILTDISARERDLQAVRERVSELETTEVPARRSALSEAESALSTTKAAAQWEVTATFSLRRCELRDELRRREDAVRTAQGALEQSQKELVQQRNAEETQARELATAKEHKVFFDRLHKCCADLDLPADPPVRPADASALAGAAPPPRRPRRLGEGPTVMTPPTCAVRSSLQKTLDDYSAELKGMFSAFVPAFRKGAAWETCSCRFPLAADEASFASPAAQELLEDLKKSYQQHEKDTAAEGCTPPWNATALAEECAKLRRRFDERYDRARAESGSILHPQGDGPAAAVRVGHASRHLPLPTVHHQLRWIAMDGSRAAHEIRAVNPLATAESIAVVLEQLTIAAVCLTYRHKLQRIIQLARQLSRAEEHSEHLSRAITAEYENRRDTKRTLAHPEWLLFEVENRLCIRPRQLDVAERMCTHNNELWQLNMGEGKSKVIIPMIISHMAGKGPPVRVIVPSPLFQVTYEYLRSVFSGLLRRKTYMLPFDRGCKLHEGRVKRLRAQLQECEQEGGVLVCAPEHCNSLRLRMLVEAHRAKHAAAKYDYHYLAPPGANDLLRGLCHLVDAPTCDILDECDELLRPRYQLIYAEGSQQPVDAAPLRWRVPMAVFRILKEEAARLEQRGGDRFLCIAGESCCPRAGARANRDDCAEMRILDMGFMGELSEHVLGCIFTDSPPEEVLCMRFPRQHRALARRFVTKPGALSAQEAAVLRERGDEAWNVLLILRGFFAHGVLGHALSKRHRVEYGLHPESGKRVAVPFRGKDEPVERTEFQHSDVMIAFTILSYYYTGMTEEQVCEAFRELLKDSTAGDITDGARSTYERWLELSAHRMTPADAHLLRKLERVDVEDPRCCAALHRCFSRNTECVNFFLHAIVFPKEAVQFPESLICNAWHLSDGGRVRGFSGTNDNRPVLPSFVKQGVIESLKGTNGKLVHLLTDPGKGNTRCELARSDDPNEVIEHIIASDASVLLDAGACIVGKTNRQVAEYVLAHTTSDRFRGALFFSDAGRPTVLDRSGGCHSVTSSPISLRDCFIYLDDTHTRGTDLKLAPKAVAVLTLGKDMNKDKFVQAAMRMRQLGQGQTVRCWCPRDVMLLMPKQRRQGCLKSVAVLEWVLANTARALEDDMVHWASQGLGYHRQMQAHGAVSDWAGSARREHAGATYEDFLACRALIHEPETMLLPDLFDHSVEPVKASNLVLAWVRKCERQIDAHVSGPGREGVTNAVLHRTQVYLSTKEVKCSQLDSECEREIEQVREQQKEVERPRDATPVREQGREWSLVVDGDVPLSQCNMEHQTLEQSLLCASDHWRRRVEQGQVHFNIPGEGWHVYASGNFCSTVTRPGWDFLRPVEWVLTKGTEAMLVSGFEAGRILAALRERVVPGRARLHHVSDLFGYSSYPPAQCCSSPLRSTPSTPPDFRRASVVIRLAAGRCRYDRPGELSELRAVLGKIDPGAADVAALCDADVATPCGFVLRQGRPGDEPALLAATRTRAFLVEPTILIEELVRARDSARHLPGSDLARVLRGDAGRAPRAAHADPCSG